MPKPDRCLFGNGRGARRFAIARFASRLRVTMFPRKAYSAGCPEPDESPSVGWGEARTPALLGTATQTSAVGVRFAHPNLPYCAGESA